MGDVKLEGLMAGYPLILVALLLAVISGGLIASLMLLTRLKSRKDAIRFYPFMAYRGPGHPAVGSDHLGLGSSLAVTTYTACT